MKRYREDKNQLPLKTLAFFFIGIAALFLLLTLVVPANAKPSGPWICSPSGFGQTSVCHLPGKK